jgi:hypothetical protein
VHPPPDAFVALSFGELRQFFIVTSGSERQQSRKVIGIDLFDRPHK